MILPAAQPAISPTSTTKSNLKSSGTSSADRRRVWWGRQSVKRALSRAPSRAAVLCLNQAMFARKIRVEYGSDGHQLPCPLKWLDSFSMRKLHQCHRFRRYSSRCGRPDGDRLRSPARPTQGRDGGLVPAEGLPGQGLAFVTGGELKTGSHLPAVGTFQY